MELPEEWTKVRSQDARKFEAELANEVCDTHVLAGTLVSCIARRGQWDDFLFALIDREPKLAVAHLTWSKEATPDFPWTTLFEDNDDFVQNWRRIFD